MKVKEHLAELWSRNHGHPKGITGWLVGEQMVRQHRPETDWTLSLLEIESTDTILEVGFGAGRAIKLAAERANSGRVMGIDISAAMVRVARQRNVAAVRSGRVVLSQGDSSALPFDDQQFDKIMSIHSIYFWPEPVRTISELYRVLKPAGKLVITLSTGKINDQDQVEIYPPFQALLEEQVLPEMQHKGFKDVRLVEGPNSRQYTSVAVIGEK